MALPLTQITSGISSSSLPFFSITYVNKNCGKENLVSQDVKMKGKKLKSFREVKRIQIKLRNTFSLVLSSLVCLHPLGKLFEFTFCRTTVDIHFESL